MRIERTETYQATIFIAGDYAKALRLCQTHCDEVGLCVTVEPTTYIYTGGAEAGVRIGLINYPRFPSTPADIFNRAHALAMILLDELAQTSVSIAATDGTTWFSRRVEDIQPRVNLAGDPARRVLSANAMRDHPAPTLPYLSRST